MYYLPIPTLHINYYPLQSGGEKKWSSSQVLLCSSERRKGVYCDEVLVEVSYE